MSKKQKLVKELQRVTEILKQKYHPEKIILYGSLASGKIHEWSDIDIALLKKTDKSFCDRIHEVSQLINTNEAVSFLVYTPKEFADLKKWHYFIKDELVKKGKIIYEKP